MASAIDQGIRWTMARANRGTVVFDLGGVLIDWSLRHLDRKLFAREEEASYIADAISAAAPSFRTRNDTTVTRMKAR